MRHCPSESRTSPKSWWYWVLAGVKVPAASRRPIKGAVSTTPESLTCGGYPPA